jgi:glucokinase
LDKNKEAKMDEITKVENQTSKILAAGAIIGALTGIGTAYLLTKNAEREGEELAISTGQGLKLGLLILGMLRQILKLDG